jgi:stearoyl-CoA desaturase (delta-9 desaturase)
MSVATLAHYTGGQGSMMALVLDETSLLIDTQHRRRTAIDAPFLHRMQRRHFIMFDVLPLMGTVSAIVLAFYIPITWLDIALFAGMWLLTGLGISVGYHRLFTHRSFKTTSFVRVLLTVLGCMAAQGAPISWAAMHRRHHQCADCEGDMHSPNLHGTSLRDRVGGFIHAHYAWMIKHEYPNVVHYTPDLLRERPLIRTARLYRWWIVLGLALPFVVGGLVTQTGLGALTGLLWGGVVRMFVVGQSISALNSVLHTMGTRPFPLRENPNDNSRNNWLLGLMIWGEGWHNNHHAFPDSAWFGLAWHRLDLGYWCILLLKRLGLAWDVRVPTNERIAARAAETRLAASRVSCDLFPPAL